MLPGNCSSECFCFWESYSNRKKGKMCTVFFICSCLVIRRVLFLINLTNLLFTIFPLLTPMLIVEQLLLLYVSKHSLLTDKSGVYSLWLMLWPSLPHKPNVNLFLEMNKKSCNINYNKITLAYWFYPRLATFHPYSVGGKWLFLQSIIIYQQKHILLSNVHPLCILYEHMRRL